MLLLISSYVADLIFGDPEWFPHPVRLMGRLISFLDNRLRGHSGWRRERIKGVILAFLVIGISTAFAYLFIEVPKRLDPFLGSLAWIYLGYTTLSTKDLRVKAKEILEKIEENSLIEARKKLSKIVGRDTQDLSKEKIIEATVESVAENTNDGIIAPLFYLILGGPILGITYKAINTLDSMVGYKNEKYLYFGWFSARLDDAANFIPARITGILIALSSAILLFSLSNFHSSLRIMLLDGRKHPSPNSGISEAAMAGALGIRLGGPSTYKGILIDKPFIGEEKRKIEPFLIGKSLNISLLTSLLMVLGGVVLQWAIY